MPIYLFWGCYESLRGTREHEERVRLMHLDGRFWPVSVLQTRLVESLLLQLHGEGLSWAVTGLFPG